MRGYVADFGDGLVGVDYGLIDYDPPPTRVLAASALQRKVFGVATGPMGEELIIIPTDATLLNPPPPTIVPVTGVDPDGTPLSLAYSARDAQLYLLDQVQRHGQSARLRLLRMAPTGSYATVLASMPDFRAGSDVYLSVGPRGDLLFARSKDPGSTLFMTLHPTEDSVELTGSLVQQGTLVAAPDSRMVPGFSVVMRHRPKGPIQVPRIPWSYLTAPGKAGQLPPRWE